MEDTVNKLFICACNNVEHQLVMTYFTDDKEVYCSVHLKPEPILTEEARLAQFTNEGGVGGHIRFLQNITGLWILQRLMSEWKMCGEEQNYDTILPQAAEAEIDTIIPVDDAAFMNPENMD
jgi:hypothetical protein